MQTTQIYITISGIWDPALSKCTEQINNWMRQKCIQINNDKTNTDFEAKEEREKEYKLSAEFQLVMLQ